MTPLLDRISILDRPEGLLWQAMYQGHADLGIADTRFPRERRN